MKRLRCATFALTTVIGATILAICGCGGGTTFNPTPAPTAIFPQQITAGSQAFTLVVTGTNFQSNTTAQWNGVNRPALYNSTTTQMEMVVFDSDVANTGLGQVTMTNPSPGGGVSNNAITFVINPPQVNGPQITSITPSSATTGSNSALLLTVNGTNLLSTDTLSWNGTPEITTTSGNPVTSLSTSISAEDLASTELVSLSVQTTAAKVASPSVKYQIGPSSNPTPSVSSISPNTAKVGTLPTGGYILVNGSNFVPSSTVFFNGSARSTGYLSGGQIAAAVLQSDVAGGGTVTITVSNPSPGGGASGGNGVTFTVSP